MITFVDNSNIEPLINTLKWLKVMLSQLGERQEKQVTLKYYNVLEESVLCVFSIDNELFSIKMTIENIDIFKSEFVVCCPNNIRTTVTYEQFINWKITRYNCLTTT